MKRGFTLLELLIVIIIIGVLATLGLTQYNAVVERSRGAEARQILGQLRSICAGYWMGSNDAASCDKTNLSIDTTPGIPGTNCAGTHYFKYSTQTDASDAKNVINITATRCTGGTGKNPSYNGAGTPTVVMIANLSNGSLTITPSGVAY